MPFLNIILDFIFPPKCIGCKNPGDYLCAKCIQKTRIAERENLEWIYSRFDYRDPVIKKALWLLKYKNKKQIAKTFGKLIYELMLEELVELETMENFTHPVIIPIPLSPKRRRKRGFNQAELISKAIINTDTANSLAINTTTLIKVKETTQQARIKNRTERLQNLKDSFALASPHKIKGRNIILVDDVTTTGATLKEARKVLKAGGAKEVYAFTLAH